MKNLFLSLLVLLCSVNSKAQTTVESSNFKVDGNCEMCKQRIEKAAKSINGVSFAKWNIESKIITVKYKTTKTNLDSIHKAISEMGYKTDKIAATETGYEALPHCCKVKGACNPIELE